MATTALARTSEIDRYMAEISRFPVLDAAEERRLALRWRDHGDVSAAHALVTSNLRFVVKIAHEYKGYGLRLLDLIQEGSIGLMQAVKRFDPDRGYRLLSYAVYWIRSYIHAFLMSSLRMIKLGTSRAHRRLFFKLRALKGRIEATGVTERDAVLDAVVGETGVDRESVEEMDRHLSTHDTPLDRPVEQSSRAIVEQMPDPRPTSEEQLAEMESEADLSARLDAAVHRLDPREREIIERRYLSETPAELKQIGEQMGVTKQRVSQLERRALGKLRRALLEAA